MGFMINRPDSTGKRNRFTQIIIYGALICFLALLPAFAKSPYTLHILILTLIYMVAAASMRFIMTSGQIPLAHGAFMGLGAYVSGVLSKNVGLSPWLTLIAAALVAMGIGMAISFPFARLKTFYYSMISLFFGVGLLQTIESFGKLTGGLSGITAIPTLFSGASKVPFYYTFLALTLISLIVLYRLEVSRTGRNLKAIEQSYLVAGSVGINEVKYRVLAVAVGCFFAGLAGGMYATYNVTLSPSSFDMAATLWLIIYVTIGGMGNFAGPIIGTALLFLLPQYYRGLKQYTPFISAAILFLVLFTFRDGLVSVPGLVASFLKNRKKGKVQSDNS
jgi:branched-chain amino acid transport system permease protein